MRYKNTIYRYGAVAKFLHWSVALLIIGMLMLGFYMTSLSIGPDKFKLIGIHKSIGIIVLCFVTIRLCWKLANIALSLPKSIPMRERYLAHAGHAILYILMITAPISGWVMSSSMGFPVSVFGWFTLPNIVFANSDLKNMMRELHSILAWSIIILASLHMLAALMHHFYYRNNVLLRMLPFAKENAHETGF